MPVVYFERQKIYRRHIQPSADAGPAKGLSPYDVPALTAGLQFANDGLADVAIIPWQFSAVPEASSFLLLGAVAALTGVACRLRRPRVTQQPGTDGLRRASEAYFVDARLHNNRTLARGG